MMIDNTAGAGSLDANASKDSLKKIHLDFFHEDTNSHQSTSCSNCGKIGHLFYQCKLPITSYGIILFRFMLNYVFNNFFFFFKIICYF